MDVRWFCFYRKEACICDGAQGEALRQILLHAKRDSYDLESLVDLLFVTQGENDCTYQYVAGAHLEMDFGRHRTSL